MTQVKNTKGKSTSGRTENRKPSFYADFDTLRSFLSAFYVEGYKTKDELYVGAKNKLSQTFDQASLPDRAAGNEDHGYFVKRFRGRKAVGTFSVDTRLKESNPLFAYFKTRSFTSARLIMYFTMLNHMKKQYAESIGQAKGPEWIGSNVIQKEIRSLLNAPLRDENGRPNPAWQYYYAFFPEGVNAEDTSHEPDLSSYMRCFSGTGIWVTSGQRWRLSPMYDASVISAALRYISEVAPCGVIGSFILDTIPYTTPQESVCTFKHHFIYPALDSEILYRLLTAMREHSFVCAGYVPKGIVGRDAGRHPAAQTVRFLPLRIDVSRQTGRQYVVGVTEADGNHPRFSVFRLDRMRELELTHTVKESVFSRLREELRSAETHTWGVNSTENRQKVTFCVKYGDEPFIRARLEKERRFGVAAYTTSMDDRENLCTVTLDVTDPLETFPWIRSFTGRLASVDFPDGDTERFADRIVQTWSLYRRGGASFPFLRAEDTTDTGAVQPDAVGKKAAKAKGRNAPTLFSELFSLTYTATAEYMEWRADTMRSSLPRLSVNINEWADLQQTLSVPKKGSKPSGGILPCSNVLMSITGGCSDKEVFLDLPRRPLTDLEKSWLKAVTADPRFRLFVDEDQWKTLNAYLPDDLPPLFEPEDIRYFDTPNGGDPYEDAAYKSRFTAMLGAIRSGKELLVTYRADGKAKRKRHFRPDHFEYSEKDDVFRVIGTGLDKGEPKLFTLNMGRVLAVDPVTDSVVPEAGALSTAPVNEPHTLELTAYDDGYSLDRILLQLSHFRHEVHRGADARTYRVIVHYDPNDEAELVCRILSIGPYIRVNTLGSIRDKVMERLDRQLELFGKRRSTSAETEREGGDEPDI